MKRQVRSGDLARVAIVGRAGPGVVALDHLDDHLAEGPGLAEFGETPLGIIPVRAQEDQQRLGPLDFAVEGLFPVRPWLYAVVLIEVEKGRRKTLFLQPILPAFGGGVVEAGMGKEDAGGAWQEKSPWSNATSKK